MFDAQAIIAEATAEAPQPETNAPVQEAEATSEEAHAAVTSEENSQESEDVSKKPDSELTPEQLAKREANRQSHLNRKLAKQRLREENRELKARLEKLEQSLQPKPQAIPDDYPKYENYDDHLEYVKAVAKYEAKQELKASQPKQPEVDPYKVKRTEEIGLQAQEFAKKVPEYASLVSQNAQFLNAMPETVQLAFLEAEDAPMALYALMKEDRLEDLEDLSPSRIAMEIGKAEERGRAYLSAAKKVSTTPPPIESLKGTGRVARDDSELSVEELLKKYNR